MQLSLKSLWMMSCRVLLKFSLGRYPENVMKWINEDARELYSQMDDDLIMTAYLIQERIKGTQSRWYPWIRVGDVFSMNSRCSHHIQRSFHPFPTRRWRRLKMKHSSAA